jgi:DNA adenine methylase
MNGGPIGGIHQSGQWKLNARFNRAELTNRCKRVADYRDRITISATDGLEMLGRISESNAFFFIDPPYVQKGKTLYLNSLTAVYHKQLAERLNSMQTAAWVLTYDDCAEVRRLYRGWATIRSFGLRYAAAERRSGREVLITPKWLRLPKTQASAAIKW